MPSHAWFRSLSMPGWEDILLLGAQLNPPPLDEDDPVTTMTVIGRHAKRPMILKSPEASRSSGSMPPSPLHIAVSAIADPFANAILISLDNAPKGEDVQSPSKFPELNSKADLKDMVDMLRNRSDGRPIGIKIAAGRIERDLEYCVYAEPDFITIDGRGGATGSSPLFLREATTVPTMYGTMPRNPGKRL